MFMHARPGIVDGARKTSQVGWWVRGGARGRSCRFSSSPMLEAISSRDQCKNVAPSVVHHIKTQKVLTQEDKMAGIVHNNKHEYKLKRCAHRKTTR